MVVATEEVAAVTVASEEVELGEEQEEVAVATLVVARVVRMEVVAAIEGAGGVSREA